MGGGAGDAGAGGNAARGASAFGSTTGGASAWGSAAGGVTATGAGRARAVTGGGDGESAGFVAVTGGAGLDGSNSTLCWSRHAIPRPVATPATIAARVSTDFK